MKSATRRKTISLLLSVVLIGLTAKTAATAPQPVLPNPVLYLMGLEPFSFAGKTFYGHTGGGDNYGSWLAYLPEEKLALSYMTNAKVYPVGNIMKGLTEIYYGRPFEIPTFEAPKVSPEILDRYVGVYVANDAPVKFTITRDGATLLAQPPGQSKAAPLEATAEDKFQISNAGPFFEFDAEKKQMLIKRGAGQRIFTKEK